MPSFEERLGGARRRKSAQEHNQKIEDRRAQARQLVAEEEERQRIEAIKKKP